MSYRLQKDESLPGGLKRIAEEEITGAIQQLQSTDDLDRSVYEVRKHLKRIRAILRLLEPYLGPIYMEENRRLRDLAHRFSGLRDIDVSLDLLETFANRYKRKSTLNPQRQALADKQSALKQQTDWQNEFAQSVDALLGTRKRIEDWPIHGLTTVILESQVKRTHKQSRHAFQRAKQTRTPEDFHALRKSVKRELNQLRLLKSDESRIQTLKQLSTLLGDHHNLAVLMTTLENTSGRFRAMTQRNLRQQETQILFAAASLYDASHRAAVA
jgi:CHAD domain-containing protein